MTDATDATIIVDPPHKPKSSEFARQLLAERVPGLGGRLTIRSEIPEAKGLASSSADLVATYRALVDAVPCLRMTADEVARAMCCVEPSDAAMYEAHVAFAHRSGGWVRILGHLPPARIAAVDTGGSVDSVSFNQRLAEFTPEDWREYTVLLERLGVAFAARRLADVGAVATRSAELAQERNPLPMFAELREIAAWSGASGVIVTHSGTMAGLLVDCRQPRVLAMVMGALAPLGLPMAIHEIGRTDLPP